MHDIDLSFYAVFKMAATLRFAAIQTVTIFCDNPWVGDNSYSSSNHLFFVFLQKYNFPASQVDNIWAGLRYCGSLCFWEDRPSYRQTGSRWGKKFSTKTYLNTYESTPTYQISMSIVIFRENCGRSGTREAIPYVFSCPRLFATATNRAIIWRQNRSNIRRFGFVSHRHVLHEPI
jgi:hypothetical protein